MSTEETESTLDATVGIRFMSGETLDVRQIVPGVQRLILIEPVASGTEEHMEIRFDVTASLIGEEKDDLINILETLVEILKEGDEQEGEA